MRKVRMTARAELVNALARRYAVAVTPLTGGFEAVGFNRR